MAIAAKHRLNLFEVYTKKVFLNGDIGSEKIHVRPPDWWPEHGYALQLMKSIYGTRQAARQLHVCVSTWMEEQGYLTVNRTLFM